MQMQQSNSVNGIDLHYFPANFRSQSDKGIDCEMISNDISAAMALKEKLVQRRAKIIRSVSELDDEIGRVHSFIKDWHYYANMDVNSLSSAKRALPSQTLSGRNPRKEVVAAQALKILTEHGAPMKTRELVNALRASGISLNGKSPRATLGAILSRMPSMIKRTSDRHHWTVA
jgi:hypothetical protein